MNRIADLPFRTPCGAGAEERTARACRLRPDGHAVNTPAHLYASRKSPGVGVTDTRRIVPKAALPCSPNTG